MFVIKKIKKFKKFEKQGQWHIMKLKTKYATGLTPRWPKVVTFTQFLPKVSNEETSNGQEKGRGRGWERGRGHASDSVWIFSVIRCICNCMLLNMW